MGHLINQISFVLHKFFGRLREVESGSFTLGTGYHVVTVPFKIRANAIWVSISEDGVMDGCGQIPINTVGYYLGKKKPKNINEIDDDEDEIEYEDVHHPQATFYVTVATERCRVNWFAKRA